MTQKDRLIALLSAAVVLLGAGVVVAVNLVFNRVNNSITQADLFGPSPSTSLTPSPTNATPPPGADITGPLNFLIVGEDTRPDEPEGIPHGDAVMIMHVTADVRTAYLTSLPRDLLVNVPAFAPSRTGASRTKLTHALTYGSRVPGSSRANTAQGFQLMAQTVSRYTGIDHFDAGALINFVGLPKLVDALGGIDMYVDNYVQSIHIDPNGNYRSGCEVCAHGYSGPQMTYNVGMMHLNGWQALDYSRQRYGLPGGDYARERHHRQMIKAIMAKVISRDLVLNPVALDNVLSAIGSALIFDGRGRKPTEFAYALRNLRPESVTLVGLPGSSAYSGGGYVGENLNGVQTSYFAALRNDKLAAFVTAHPDLVNTTPA